MTTHRPLVALLAVLAVTLGACSGSSEPDAVGPAGADAARVPVVVDYSPTLSDVPALLYLATHEAVDLLAVTLPGTGEADCEPGVRLTAQLLRAAGAQDVPVGCGRDTPLAGDRDWPAAWREAANALGEHLDLPTVEPATVDAEALLADVLADADEPVTVVTLAPFTNLGAVLRGDPALAERIARVVAMGGAFRTRGNVEEAPRAEWNLHVDPEAVRAVLDAGAPITFVGLDATNDVPGSRSLVVRQRAAATTTAAEVVRDLWRAHHDTVTGAGWYLWDELAATVALRPEIVTVETRTIRVDDIGATLPDRDGIAVQVATSADTGAFEAELLRVFAGGTVPEFGPPTAAEVEYLAALDAATTAMREPWGAAYAALEAAQRAGAARAGLEEFAAATSGALAAFAAELDALAPPSEFVTAHGALAAATEAVVARFSELPEALDRIALPPDASEDEIAAALETVASDAGLTDRFDAWSEACAAIEDVAFTRGAAPQLCNE